MLRTPVSLQEVAIYKGDELIFMGSIGDAAKQLNVQPATIYFYTMPSYQRRLDKREHDFGKRIAVVRVDSEEADLCPMGCGRLTEDPYGGPCAQCWKEAPHA